MNKISPTNTRVCVLDTYRWKQHDKLSCNVIVRSQYKFLINGWSTWKADCFNDEYYGNNFTLIRFQNENTNEIKIKTAKYVKIELRLLRILISRINFGNIFKSISSFSYSCLCLQERNNEHGLNGIKEL